MRLVAFFSLFLMVSASVLAETEMHSRFGVTLFLPDNWRLLTLDELHAVDEADSSGELPVDTQVQMKERKKLSETMRSGGLELIFNTEKIQGTGGFYDNITLIETNDQVPEAASQIKSTCAALPGLLSRTLARKVQLATCKGVSVQDYPAFVISYTGDVADTHIIQYMLQLEQSRSLVLTLTYHNKNMAAVKDFESAIQGLKFN